MGRSCFLILGRGLIAQCQSAPRCKWCRSPRVRRATRVKRASSGIYCLFLSSGASYTSPLDSCSGLNGFSCRGAPLLVTSLRSFLGVPPSRWGEIAQAPPYAAGRLKAVPTHRGGMWRASVPLPRRKWRGAGGGGPAAPTQQAPGAPATPRTPVMARSTQILRNEMVLNSDNESRWLWSRPFSSRRKK
jgi:hypothetical protein